MIKIFFLTLIALAVTVKATVNPCAGNEQLTRFIVCKDSAGNIVDQVTTESCSGDVTLSCAKGWACLCPTGKTYKQSSGAVECVDACDVTPPTANCPANIVEPVPNDSDRRILTWTVNCEDDYSTNVQPVCTGGESGDTFSLGEVTTISCTCTDDANLSSQCSFTVEVVDETNPVPQCPVDMTLTISDSANEAALEFSASCSDNSGEEITVSCSRSLTGETLRFADSGEEITCSCSDSSGNSDTCSFTVTVQDETDPVPQCPADMTLTISDSANEAALEFSASCSDNSEEEITVSCSRSLTGETLSLADSGEEITCSCSDSSSNSDTCSFTVTVRDETDPVPECPADMTLTISDSANEAALEFSASCSDNSEEEITVSCSRSLTGETLSLADSGEEITCSCSDSSSNSDTCSFTVSVQDDTAPEISCVNPATVFVVGPDFEDVAVSFDTPTCTDNSGNDDLTIECDEVDDSYSIGSYNFTCTCEDSSGNSDTCTITAVVDGQTDLQCVAQEEAFTADDDPDNPLELEANLILPEIGEYEIQVTATPLSGTPGTTLDCTYTVTIN